ncbi:MAG: hypothetical protein H0V27_09390 [Pyrinomonadaceae bacterium]|nr:hypothetical protein [Pyrinomonadaceae bacterium]
MERKQLRSSETIFRNPATACAEQHSERTNTKDEVRDRRVEQNWERRIKRARRLQAIRARRREERRGVVTNSAGNPASAKYEESYKNSSCFERLAW